MIQLTIPPSAEPRVVTLDVVRILAATVRIGIEADRDIEIWRGELDAATRPAA